MNYHPHMNTTMEADPIPHGGTYNQDDPSSPSSVAELLRRTGVATLRRVDATGFIRLNGLRPARGIAAKVRRKK